MQALARVPKTNPNSEAAEKLRALKGHGFSRAAQPPLWVSALGVLEKLLPVKGTGFSPYINPAKSLRALAPEGCFSAILLRTPPCSAACLALLGLSFLAFLLAAPLPAQTSAAVTTMGTSPSGPIAIVPLDSRDPGSAAVVTGALEVTQGKAIIAASGAVTSGAVTTEVVLPRRGVLRVCASTTVKLAADSSVPAGEVPGLLMALDHGAMEASFATGRNSDILLTPDFRILIGGPGAAEVKVRLGEHGDTCVDNPGVNAPYVIVTSVFDGGVYRVQPGQRVMFQHGNLSEVVDHEKEPCGCPPPPHPGSNEFPLAQSAGLAPLPAPVPAPAGHEATPGQLSEPLVYRSAEPAPEPSTEAAPILAAGTSATQPAKPPAIKKKSGMFGRISRFFRRMFGAE
jgi:hypothetical protein